MEQLANGTPLEEERDTSSVPVEDVPENATSDNEEEDECRVCRGPAEEGHPLFSPCKCSGTIGLVHQDCLVSWLEVTRKEGRCDICKTKFRFDPQYAENAPDRLPAHEVVLGLCSRFLAMWLPLALRILLAATLWLVVAPLLTACLYNGWMHRPSSILTRWSRVLIPGDIVSGAIIVAIIIISFLSLMSFADFLRVHWGEPENEAQRRRNGHANDFPEDDAETEDDEGAVDVAVVEYVKEHENTRRYGSDELNKQAGSPTQGLRQQLESTIRGALEHPAADHEDNRREHNPEGDIDEENDDEPVGFDDLDADFDDDEDGDGDDELEDRLNGNAEPPLQGRPRNDNRQFDPMDPILQDDQVDMEINVALDELLGLRGPPSTLVRNLLWLLAFNATYLGFFSFVPKTVGSAIYSGFLNTTICEKLLRTVPYMYSDDQNTTSLHASIAYLNHASEEINTTFRLPDLATTTLGYFSIAAMIVLLRYMWFLWQKFRERFSVEGTRVPSEGRGQHPPDGNLVDARMRMRNMMNDLDVDGDERIVDIGAGTAFGVLLDAAVAIVKVAILLFLKMFILPVFLGLCLDASTISLFEQTLADRLTFAGVDLFSFLLLHWVAGITFMLLVTVFLLQLREVTHPDLLARLIRPQEPQPDLLGNLMNETVITHMKRMVLSLAIYAPILLLHVTLPVQILLRSGIPALVPLFKLNFWHIIMPQMQIPLELIVFHLSMLALLERYKNTIGLMQHNWMKLMCRKMGLTEYLLPLTIDRFEFAGSKAILRPLYDDSGSQSAMEVDPFWYELYKLRERKADIDMFIESNVPSGDSRIEDKGETETNGERVLKSSFDYILLPDDDGDSDPRLLRTNIGRYRLSCRKRSDGEELVIEFWKEVTGQEIQRPPEGWDDLGAGGAFVQGRWAWGKEKKSIIEGGVAKRTKFKDPDTNRRSPGLMAKVVALVVLSWFAITFVIFGFVSIPLAVGRLMYLLFRFKAHYVHDPLAFVIGGCIVFPSMSLVLANFKVTEGDLKDRLQQWRSKFCLPPRQKLVVLGTSTLLWFYVAPLSLGLAYEMAAVKTSEWFTGSTNLFDARALVLSWMAGLTMLNGWAFLAYFSVFTKQFWANVGNGMLEPPLDENGNPAPVRNNRINNQGPREARGEDRMDWQGKNGRVARFFTVWRSALLEWDWEKVDRVTLLEEFAFPLSKQLLSTLVGSGLSFTFSINLLTLLLRSEQGLMKVPLLGGIERRLLCQLTFRVCMLVHIIVQLCSSNRGQLESWFEAAHAAARDDRYLIGEILLNYEEGVEQEARQTLQQS